jgi:WD40 repeat protein
MKHFLALTALGTALGLLAAQQDAQEKSKAPEAAKAPSEPPPRFNPNAAAVLVSNVTIAVAVSADGKRVASVGGSINSGFASVIDVASKKELLATSFPKQFSSVGISPNGKYIAIAGRSGDVKLLEADSGKTIFSKKLNSPAHVAFSPDGESITTATESKTVQIWDVPSGDEQAKLLGATMPLRCVAFSPDGKKLAAGGGVQQKKGEANGTIFVWNVVTRAMNHKLESETLAPISTIAFSPDGKRIAGVSAIRQVRIWDIAGSKVLLTTLPQPQVLGLAFSPDGQTLAAATGDGSVLLLDSTSGNETGAIKAQEGSCHCMAFTDGGKKLISGGSSRSLKLWDFADKKELATLKQEERLEDLPVPIAMAAAGDGSLVALATEDKGVIIRDGRTGVLKATLKGHEDAVTCVAFSPDNKTLATGSADKTIKLWDVATAKHRLTLDGHTNWVYALTFSHDGKTLASGAYDKTVRFWDIETGKEKGTIEAHRGSVRAVAFSPDDKMIASAGSDRFVKLWTIANRELKFAVKGHESTIRSLAFSQDGKALASGGEDGNVKFWNPETGKELVATRKEHNEEVVTIAFAGSRTLLSGGADGIIRQWDAATGAMIGDLQGHNGGVSGIAVTADGMEFLSTGADRAIKRFRQDAPGPIRFFKGHEGVVQYASFSPDGKKFVSCGAWPEGDKTLRVWDVQKGTEILKIEHPGQAAMAIFTPNGKFIVSASDDGNAYLWDAENGEKIRAFKGHTAAVEGLAFNAAGTQLLTSSSDSTVRLWSAATAREIQKFTGHTGMVRRVAFHPDGKHAVSGGRDGFVRMWDLETAREAKQFKSSSNWADSFAVSKDGKLLAVGGKNISVYEIETGKMLPECIGHQYGLTHVAFSDDGKRLLSAGYDATARLWDRATGKELYLFRNHREFLWSAAISPDGKWILTAGGGFDAGNGKYVKGSDHAVRLWKMPDEKAIAEFAEENY